MKQSGKHDFRNFPNDTRKYFRLYVPINLWLPRGPLVYYHYLFGNNRNCALASENLPCPLNILGARLTYLNLCCIYFHLYVTSIVKRSFISCNLVRICTSISKQKFLLCVYVEYLCNSDLNNKKSIRQQSWRAVRQRLAPVGHKVWQRHNLR